MKIKLLKELPWYEVGHIFDIESTSCIWYTRYTPEGLLNTWWAEEIKAPLLPKTVWDLKNGDRYLYLIDDGREYSTIWDDDRIDEERRQYNNCFLTSEDVDTELLRRGSRAKAWIPEMRQHIYSIGILWEAFETTWDANTCDFMYYHNGNIHKTKEDAYEWKAKYGKAFWIS